MKASVLASSTKHKGKVLIATHKPTSTNAFELKSSLLDRSGTNADFIIHDGTIYDLKGTKKKITID